MKIFIVIQLGVAAFILLVLLLSPLIKHLYEKKTAAILYQEIMKREPLFQERGLTSLQQQYTSYQASLPSYFKGLSFVFSKPSSVLLLIWICSACSLCLLLIFHREKSARAAWILPGLMVLYSLSLYLPSEKRIHALFPSQEYVAAHYLSPIETSPTQDDLLKGWHRYLVVEWAKEVPLEDPHSFERQVEKGLFAFNVERLEQLCSGQGEENLLRLSPSFLLLLLFFCWNVSFAWTVQKRLRGEAV